LAVNVVHLDEHEMQKATNLRDINLKIKVFFPSCKLTLLQVSTVGYSSLTVSVKTNISPDSLMM
jgi:hypothetical protein